MKKIAVLILIQITLTFFQCRKIDNGEIASVKFVKGKVEVINNGTAKIVRLGNIIRVNDIVRTGDSSVAIIALGNHAEFELQSNTEFQVQKYLPLEKDLYLSKGSIWVRVNKNAHVNGFQIRTPTVAAGVRGTKFYLHKFNGMSAICFCEGEVEFSTANKSDKTVYSQDSLGFVKNGKIVVLSPDEVKSIFGTIVHHHSEIENSPLGPHREEVSEDKLNKLNALLESKFH